MTQPYTDTELVRLAYREFRTHVYTDRYACTCGFKPGASVDWDTHVLAAVLSALAAAGRLTPAEGETRTEYNLRFRRAVSGNWIVDDSTTSPEPENDWPFTRELFGDDAHEVSRTVTTWPDGSYLVGPWLPVPTEEDTDG